MGDTQNRLLSKSKEAFILAIEIYNKPTIKYRVEGFALFICNAWELMLKAHMINRMGEESIYFADKPDRTLALTDCIKKVFTNEKDPLRLNLEKIVELRNTSTHYITEEYEMVYIPLFQACVLNYNDKMSEFHNIDMTAIIPQNFLMLSVSMKSLNENEIAAKYPEIIGKKLLDTKHVIEGLAEKENPKFAININVHHYMTKKRESADAVFHIAQDGEDPIAIFKEVKNPELVYQYTNAASLETISNMLQRKKITPVYRGVPTNINKYHFNNIVKYFRIKENPKFCWKYSVGSTDFYKYSLQALEFIVEEICKDPEHILDNVKK